MTQNSIGLDIGGSKITGIVYDGKKVLRELTIVTPKSLTEFKRSLAKLVDFLSYGKQVSKVGVGIAGIVNSHTGVVQYSPNMKYLNGFKLSKYLKDIGFKEVVVENDANCFAYMEAKQGKGKEMSNFVGLTLGTGIGAGLVSQGHLYRGAHNSAGEAGHIMADFKYDSEHYFQVARNKKDYKKMGEVVGILFANIMNLLDVEAIILGGTVSLKHHEQFLPEALRVAKLHIINKQAKPKILVSSLKHSGALGAVMMLEAYK